MLKSIQSNNSPGHSHNSRQSVVDLSTDSCPGIILKRNNKMNIIQTLLERIESYRVENKQPCKNYATKDRAEKATKEMARIAGLHFDSLASARYIVFYNEHWNRWVGAIDMSELLSRHDSKGGYLGICSKHNFFSY